MHANSLWIKCQFVNGVINCEMLYDLLWASLGMVMRCQEILSLLNKAISKTITALESYELSNAANTMYSWWQYQLCDVFIEAIKPFFTRNYLEFWVCEKFCSRHTLVMSWQWVVIASPYYAICYKRIMVAPSFIKGTDSDRINYDVQVSINCRGKLGF